MDLARSVYVNSIVCEKALREEDGVHSAIRIVDIFFYRPRPEIPLEKQQILMNVLISIKMPIENAAGEHTIRVDLVRPSGNVTTGPVFPAPISSKYTDSLAGVTINVQGGVVPKEMGIHRWVVFLDETEVSQVHFSIIQRLPEESDE